jgi:hypothetical protein
MAMSHLGMSQEHVLAESYWWGAQRGQSESLVRSGFRQRVQY